MNKKEFLGKLNKSLKKLDKKECDKYISYYDEIISDMVDGGMSEQEAVEKQGEIRDIADDILKNTDMVKKDKIGIVLICITIILAVASVICMIVLPDAGAVSLLKGDGAVTVFVVDNIKEPLILYIGTLIVAVMDIVYFVIKRRTYGIVIGAIAIIALGLTYIIFYMGDKGNSKPIDSSPESTIDNNIEARTEEIINLLNEKDYETLQNEYTSDAMRSYITSEVLENAKTMVSDDWGDFVSNSNIYETEFVQNGSKYIITQVNSMYENISVTYTITYDEDMKIAGLYMK